MNKTTKDLIKNKLKTLEALPGVYQMLDIQGNIIYIGKSIEIKRRVTSYFSPSAKRSKKITQMIYQISDFRVFYTLTELDALILECRWIKQYHPFYNTALTREHKYLYIDINQANYKLSINHQEEVFTEKMRLGPFTSYRLALQGAQYIKSHYPYFQCQFKYKNKLEICYPYQFKVCTGLCQQSNKIKPDKLIEDILGEKSGILEAINIKIEAYAANLEFERAGELLKQKEGVKYLKAIYQLLKEIDSTYIGRLIIPCTLRYKYYLVVGGRLIDSQIGYKYQEKEILATYKKLAKRNKDKARRITIKEIDEILIIKSFKHKMKVFEV